MTHDDYENVLVPEVESQTKAQGAVKMLYWLGPDFDSFTAGAMWDDTRLGLSHLGEFEKIAVVSDAGFIRAGVRLFAPLIPAPVRVFGNSELEEAKDWIASEQV